jgi:hypothetical protein
MAKFLFCGTMIKKLTWMEQGSLTKLAKGYQPKALDIEMLKAYGEAQCFFNILCKLKIENKQATARKTPNTGRETIKGM